MVTVQLASRIDPADDAAFREITAQIGVSPSEAIRVFIKAFNRAHGFPFDVQMAPVELLDSEEDATAFVSHLARGVPDEAW